MTNNTADAINMTVLSDTDLLNTTQMDAKTSWLTTSFAKLMHSAVSTTTSEPLHNVNHTTIDVFQDVHNTTILTISSTSAPLSPEENSPVAVFFVSCVFFIVAVALVLKVVLANRKKRTNLIGGSARWRLAASQQSGAGPVRTAASYVPMSNRERPAVGGLDSVGPVENMDWERQFFDDTEPTLPSRLQLHSR